MDKYGLSLATAATEEPVTPEQVRDHLRLELDQYDEEASYIDGLTRTAREEAEHILHRQFVTATWDWKIDDFPDGRDSLDVPLPPLSSVSSITYTDTDGNSQTLSTANYAVDTTNEPGRIRPITTETWPTVEDSDNPITIQFVAGYGGAGAVPDTIKQAMLIMIGHWYYHREDVGKIPDGVMRLLDAERWEVLV